MLNHRQIQKIGRAGLGAVLFLAQVALGQEIQFSAQVDESQIRLGETVTLRLSIRSEGSGTAGEPQFDAPDFEVISDSSSISVSSQYDSSVGRFSTVNIQELAKILQPMKEGNLKISNIELKAKGKTYRAPDITVRVAKGGLQVAPFQVPAYLKES